MAPSLTGHIASEDASVEQPALALLQEQGWSPPNLMNEAPGPRGAVPGSGLDHQGRRGVGLRAAAVWMTATQPPKRPVGVRTPLV
jgi:hypothetical protein